MHRSMVNGQVANIFNGVFEVQKSGQKAKNFAEMRVFGTCVSGFTMFALTMPQRLQSFTVR
jgi:hypothetical protein